MAWPGETLQDGAVVALGLPRCREQREARALQCPRWHPISRAPGGPSERFRGASQDSGVAVGAGGGGDGDGKAVHVRGPTFS